MRKRSVGINVRVSVTEKRKMTLMAKRCGLSLSEYLRQRALGYEPGGHPPKEVFNVLDKLDEIAENCSAREGAAINAQTDRMRDLLIGGMWTPLDSWTSQTVSRPLKRKRKLPPAQQRDNNEEKTEWQTILCSSFARIAFCSSFAFVLPTRAFP